MKRADWNCKLLPGFPDQIASIEDAIQALEILHTQAEITEFAFFPKYDPLTDSKAYFQLRANAALSNLQSRVSFPAKLFVRPAIYLRPELPDPTVLRHFCIPKTNFLAFSLPITPNQDTENTLARFLRHSPYRVLLLEAQLLPIFYPNDVFNRIMNLPGIALQISYQSLFLPDFAVFLHKMLKKGTPILLGSGVNSPERANRLQYEDVLQTLHDHFTQAETERILYGGLPRS